MFMEIWTSSRHTSRSACLAAIALTAVTTCTASAQMTEAFSALSEGTFDVGQNNEDGSVAFVISAAGNRSQTGAPVSFSGDLSFGDPDVYNPQMNITGSASAAANVFRLRAEASGEITNLIFDEGAEPYVDPDNGEINEDGLPEYLSITGFARYMTTLQYQSTAKNYTSRYIFRVDGSIDFTGEGFGVLLIAHADAPLTNIFTAQGAGNYNEVVTSQAYVHGNSPQTVSYQLQATIAANTEVQTQDVAGAVRFGSTASLLGIELRDADTGRLLTDAIITAQTADGEVNIPVMAVPEPASATLMLLAAGLLSRRRRAA